MTVVQLLDANLLKYTVEKIRFFWQGGKNPQTQEFDRFPMNWRADEEEHIG